MSMRTRITAVIVVDVDTEYEGEIDEVCEEIHDDLDQIIESNEYTRVSVELSLAPAPGADSSACVHCGEAAVEECSFCETRTCEQAACQDQHEAACEPFGGDAPPQEPQP